MKKGKIKLVPIQNPTEGMPVVWNNRVYRLNGQEEEDHPGYQPDYWLVGDEHTNTSYEPLRVLQQLVVEYETEPAGDNVCVNQLPLLPEQWGWALALVDGPEIPFEEIWGDGTRYFTVTEDGSQSFARIITPEPVTEVSMLGKPGKGKSWSVNPDDIKEVIPNISNISRLLEPPLLKAKVLKHRDLENTFGELIPFGRGLEIAHVHEAPQLLPMSATIEDLRNYLEDRNGEGNCKRALQQLEDYDIVVVELRLANPAEPVPGE